MKTIKLAMFCSLMMLFAGGMVGPAAAQTVAGTLGCQAFCVDLYEVTCSGSLQLIVGVESDPELVVSGTRTIPAPALTGPEVATMQLMRPGGDGRPSSSGSPGRERSRRP